MWDGSLRCQIETHHSDCLALVWLIWRRQWRDKQTDLLTRRRLNCGSDYLSLVSGTGTSIIWQLCNKKVVSDSDQLLSTCEPIKFARIGTVPMLLLWRVLLTSWKSGRKSERTVLWLSLSCSHCSGDGRSPDQCCKCCCWIWKAERNHFFQFVSLFVSCFTARQHNIGHQGQHSRWMPFNVWPSTCIRCESTVGAVTSEVLLPSPCQRSSAMKRHGRHPIHKLGSAVAVYLLTAVDVA